MSAGFSVAGISGIRPARFVCCLWVCQLEDTYATSYRVLERKTTVGKRTRRQHVVSAFYLRGFANEGGRLFRTPLTGDAPHPVAVTDATVRNDFYTITGPAGEPSDVFERFFAQLEGDAVPGLKSLTAPEPRFPVGEIRASLSMWIALQYLRSEGVRSSGAELRAAEVQITVGFSGKQRLRELIESREGVTISDARLDAEWADLTQPGGTRIEADVRDHIASIMDMLPSVSNLIHHSPWMLLRFAKKSLVTSDHPVFLIRSIDAKPWEGVGLATAFGYGIALDRHTGVIIVTSGVEGGAPDHAVPPSAFYAKLFNQRVVRNARKALYHHPEDDPRGAVGGDLPPERGTEMEVVPRTFPEVDWREPTVYPTQEDAPMPHDENDSAETWSIDDLPWPIPGRVFTFTDG